MSSRILCVNCGLCVNRIARHIVLKQNIRVVSFIAERISPRIIAEHDNICQACLDAIMKSVNQIIQGETSSIDKLPDNNHTQVIGHSKVCLMCGCSILRKKSDQILRINPSDLQEMIATVIMNSIESQELTTRDRVCHACWMKARRTALRTLENQIKREYVMLPSPSLVDEESQVELDIVKHEPSEIADNEDIPKQRSHEVDIVVPNPSISSPSPEWIPDVPSVITQNIPAQGVTITLENYRRAPNTAAQCIFPHCTNWELHRISDDLRIKIIIDHNFYLPVHARVCTDHLKSNMWDTLYDSEKSNAVFTVEQVEHVFSFINSNRTNIMCSTKLSKQKKVRQKDLK